MKRQEIRGSIKSEKKEFDFLVKDDHQKNQEKLRKKSLKKKKRNQKKRK
jgi:hypothetical protein